MKQILVIDGLGGGLGSEIISRLKGISDIEIVAVGTNSFATGNMLKLAPTGVLQERML